MQSSARFSQATGQTLFNGLITGLITVIFLLSFRSFAAFLARSLNSDNAVHILMSYDFQIPDDLYYWGQDRLGSIVPMLGCALMKVVPLEPIVAVSIVQYFLLLLGFVCFAALFKKPLSRLVLALVWFLPFKPFIHLIRIGQPYGAQFAFLGVATVLFDQLLKHRTEFSEIRKHILLAAALGSLFISLWISDFSIVPIFTLAILGGVETYRELKPALSQGVSTIRPLLRYGINIIAMSSIGIALILYAKDNAINRGNYASFNTLKQIIHVLRSQIQIFLDAITFKEFNLWHSIFNLCVLGLVAILASVWMRSFLVCNRAHSNRPTSFSFSPSPWFYIFLSNSVISFLLLILSNWVYDEEKGFGPRYFTFVYVTLWLTVLFIREGFNRPVSQQLLCLFLTGAVASNLTLPNYVYSLQKVQSEYSRLQALEAIAPAGIIGNYWSSYVLCSANPADLKCTSRDQKGERQGACLAEPATQEEIGAVRCERCVNEVFNSPKLYLVKEKWFNAFPQEIQQFGHCLIPIGQPIKLGGYTLRPYGDRATFRTSASG